MDLYSGTGNLGIEALSRGAKFSVFIDKSPECYNIIMENLIHTKLIEKARVLTREVVPGLSDLSREKEKYDIVFLDPPYNKNLVEETLNTISKAEIINPDGIIIAERDVDDRVPAEIGNLKNVRNQKYGDTVLSFYILKE